MNKKKIADSENNFAGRLGVLRRRARLKQKELAQRLGITSSYLSELESGLKSNPSSELLERICSEFSVTKDWLLGAGDLSVSSQDLIAAVTRRDYPYAFSVSVEMLDTPALLKRADEVLAEAGRPLDTRVQFGTAVLAELERRENLATDPKKP